MIRLNTTKRNVFKFALFCSIIFVCFACSDSEAQQDFEDIALQPPAGIMAMDASGTPTEEESDTTDWQTAPDYRNLVGVEVTPAFPNPVPFNDEFKIEINIGGSDVVNGLYIDVFQQVNELNKNDYLRTVQGSLELGLHSFLISPQEFAPSGGTGTIGNTWRIILFDGRRNIISYGDVLVE